MNTAYHFVEKSPHLEECNSRKRRTIWKYCDCGKEDALIAIKIATINSNYPNANGRHVIGAGRGRKRESNIT